jgi:hypothetical protein
VIDPVLYRDGQVVDVWCNASGWQPAVIVGHFFWTHWSGNTHVAYRVSLGQLADGTPEIVNCSANSLRSRRGRRTKS